MPPTHSFPAMHLFFSPQRHRGGSNENKPNPIPFSSLCLCASVVQFHLPCFQNRDTEAQRGKRTTTNPIPFPFLLCTSVPPWFNFISLVFTTETQRHRGGTEREQTQSHSLFFSVPLCLRGSISSLFFTTEVQRHRGGSELNLTPGAVQWLLDLFSERTAGSMELALIPQRPSVE